MVSQFLTRSTMLELLELEGQICHKSNMCFPSNVPSFEFQKNTLLVCIYGLSGCMDFDIR